MTRLQKKIQSLVSRASKQFDLIEPNDRILVGVSGGKDSYVMLHMLREIQRKVPWSFELIAVNLDQGHPGFPQAMLASWLEENGYPHHMLAQDTYSIVLDKVPEGKTYCSLCSRLRRGILYNAAQELGCTKIALGHHQDDVIETLMLNLLYSGQLKAMPPRLQSDDGRNVVIRPLVLCAEEDVAAVAQEIGFPIIPCDLCGTQEDLKRQRVKRLIDRLNRENPNVRGNLFAALGNVRSSHLLDTRLWELEAGAASSDAVAAP